MLRHAEGKLELIGKRPMRMFRKGTEPFEVQPGSDLSFLL
jgi:dipeptidase E